MMENISLPGRTYRGFLDGDELIDGVELTTDRDFEQLGNGDSLSLRTVSGRKIELFGPEQQEGVPGLSLTSREGVMLMPRIERIGVKRFRLRLTPAQEGLLRLKR